ncbi:chaperone protein ClpC, chloroplastic-like [Papaver somniferum]|uniref:chaperone protein ClpC, chloroplastic-like n=1 Tax=Papaver somniferum TaxID=3469 RepID=UPI000E7034AA|nr:chaperone protein ClpC, chloroplastic-like [Papaver somniferum]
MASPCLTVLILSGVDDAKTLCRTKHGHSLSDSSSEIPKGTTMLLLLLPPFSYHSRISDKQVSELRDRELDLRTLFIKGKRLSNAESELGDTGPVVTKVVHCCFLPSAFLEKRQIR